MGYQKIGWIWNPETNRFDIVIQPDAGKIEIWWSCSQPKEVWKNGE